MALVWFTLLLTLLLALDQGTVVDTTEEYKAMGYPDARKIVRDSEDNLYIAYRKKWVQDQTEDYHIFVAKSSDAGRSWHVTNGGAPIEQVGDYTQRVPAIAVDGNDTLHVAWYGTDAENDGKNQRQIKYSRSEDGGRTWSGWINIAQVEGYDGHRLWQEHPTIYVDRGNKLYVAWQGGDAEHGRSQVKLSMSTDGGESWTPWRNINPSKNASFSRPAVITGRDGRLVYILAYSGAGSRHQIVLTSSKDGGKTWAPWAPVAAGDQDQRHAAAVIDRADHLHVVWRQRPEAAGSEAPSQVHYAVYDGAAWSAPVLVGPAPVAYQVFPSITLTDDGQVWVVWSETDAASNYPQENPGSGSIVYAVYSGQTWSRGRVRDAARDIYPSLGRHLPGRRQAVDLVWLDNADATDNLIYYRRLND